MLIVLETCSNFSNFFDRILYWIWGSPLNGDFILFCLKLSQSVLKHGPLKPENIMVYAYETTFLFLSASISNLDIWRGDLASVVWTVTKELRTHCLCNLSIKCGGKEEHVLCADDYWWRSTSHSFCSSALTWTTKYNWAS